MGTHPGSLPPARRGSPRGPLALLAALALGAVTVTVAIGFGGRSGAPSSPSPSPVPTRTEVAALPTTSPSPGPTMPPWPSVSTLPSPIDFPPPPPPTSTPKPTKKPDVATGPTKRVATRVVVPGLDIDLPVMRQKSSYPPCGVAMYLPEFKQPGRGGATYLYAHARQGMFLPLLTQSKRNNGSAMIGLTVHVYTGDNMRFTYEITRVRRHARDFKPVHAARGETIWLQTSEGPNASYPKLQVAGKLVGRRHVGHDEAHPRPRPRSC